MNPLAIFSRPTPVVPPPRPSLSVNERAKQTLADSLTLVRDRYETLRLRKEEIERELAVLRPTIDALQTAQQSIEPEVPQLAEELAEALRDV